MRTPIDIKIRNKVYERDSYACKICGAGDNLSIDHIIPLADGGLDNIDNMQTLCVKHNLLKGAKYKLPFWLNLKKIWYIHNHLQEFKNRIRFELSNRLREMQDKLNNREQALKKSITEENQSYRDKLQESIKKVIEAERLKHSIFEAGIKNIISPQTQRVDDLERAFMMLIQYLEVEVVPSKISKPYFRKIDEK